VEAGEKEAKKMKERVAKELWNNPAAAFLAVTPTETGRHRPGALRTEILTFKTKMNGNGRVRKVTYMQIIVCAG